MGIKELNALKKALEPIIKEVVIGLELQKRALHAGTHGIDGKKPPQIKLPFGWFKTDDLLYKLFLGLKALTYISGEFEPFKEHFLNEVATDNYLQWHGPLALLASLFHDLNKYGFINYRKKYHLFTSYHFINQEGEFITPGVLRSSLYAASSEDTLAIDNLINSLL